MAGGFADELGQLLKARFPLLYVETWEEDRAIAAVEAVAADTARVRTPRRTLVWTETDGLREPDGPPSPDTRDPQRALDRVVAATEPTVFVLVDLHARLGAGGRPDSALVRRLRDVVAHLRGSPVPVAVVLLSPVLQIPVELEKSTTVVDFRLPDEQELRELLQEMLRSNATVKVLADDLQLASVVRAALGLTEVEAENAFARAIAAGGALDAAGVDVVLEEKRQTIRKSGVLELVAAPHGFEGVGGLEELRGWLAERSGAWMAAAEGYPLPAPKGVLVTGVPGCGKSLTATCTAALWGLPLLRLDLGRVFAGLVGSSEQNMRRALRTAEAIAPCVLWIDEVEKGFGGTDAAAGDSGTSQRVFGTFLTWLQEKTAPVFVFATANSIERLPPEFLRKGRFDEVFFVDLPTRSERRAVWRVHLQRRVVGRFVGELDVDEALLDSLAQVSDGFSGAEVEQAVITALFAAYARRRPLRRDDLLLAVQSTVPLSVTSAEQVATMREWASVRAVAATGHVDRDLDGPGLDTWDGGHPGGWTDS